MIVERFGQFSRLCPAGLHFLVPFVDAPRPLLWRSTEVTLHSVRIGHVSQTLKISQSSVNKVDLRENIMDFPSQVRGPMVGAVTILRRCLAGANPPPPPPAGPLLKQALVAAASSIPPVPLLPCSPAADHHARQRSDRRAPGAVLPHRGRPPRGVRDV